MKEKKEQSTFFGFNKKQRSRLYTIAFVVVAALFILINNSDEVPAQGPYPVHYQQQKSAKILNLSDYRGKVVLVDFWATWCPPCRKGIPDLVELKKKYKNADFEIIGVALDKVTRGGNTEKDVIPFIKDYKINYPIVWGDLSTPNQFGEVHAIPTTFFLNKDGKVVNKIEGLASKEDLDKQIQSLLKEKRNKKFKESVPNFSLPLAN